MFLCQQQQQINCILGMHRERQTWPWLRFVSLICWFADSGMKAPVRPQRGGGRLVGLMGVTNPGPSKRPLIDRIESTQLTAPIHARRAWDILDSVASQHSPRFTWAARHSLAMARLSSPLLARPNQRSSRKRLLRNSNQDSNALFEESTGQGPRGKKEAKGRRFRAFNTPRIRVPHKIGA